MYSKIKSIGGKNKNEDGKKVEGEKLSFVDKSKKEDS
jgi:hypothetical protein